MKVGDFIICHTPVIMNNSTRRMTTKNKKYYVSEIRDGCIIILNDHEEHHWFDIDGVESNYRQWFYTERKMKLDKLNKCLHI